MITFITHIPVRAENAAAFEAILAEMAAQVREHEPGVAHYGYAKSVEVPDTYVVIEVYRDEAAFNAHWGSDYIMASLSKTQPLIEGVKFEVRQYVSPGTAAVNAPLAG